MGAKMKELTAQRDNMETKLSELADNTASLEPSQNARETIKATEVSSEALAGEFRISVEIRKPDVSMEMMRSVNQAFHDIQ
jgi:hypothetical protein